MPWTFAHPAAALPLRKLCPRPLSFAGLVIGSMTPDIGYYIGQLSLGGKTHSLSGIFEICLPVGLLGLMLVRRLHRPVAEMLPEPHRRALLSLAPPASLHTPGALGIATVSVVLGALTHVGWDAFTHVSGLVVRHIHALRLPLFSLGTRTFHVYNVLQHASTAAGIALLATAYVRFLRRQTPQHSAPNSGRRTLIGALLAVAMACALPFAWADATHHGATAANVFILGVHVLVYSTTAFALLLGAAALLLERRQVY